ncbi:MAG: class I SAM-dependent methyltransferase [Candidatus Omnitrophota bacterium]
MAEKLYCAFCGGECFYRYGMEKYKIWQCQRCRTGCVNPMPEKNELIRYYEGFSPHLDMTWLYHIESSAQRLFSYFELYPGNNFKMLDIGGGGGFYSKAFEDYNYGKSTYVDLDPKSCAFAREQLKLERVFNCDAMDIKTYADKKFDFIYCRHVIEHLVDPVAFLDKVMDYLAEDGKFVVQIPNGNSLEYLAYPDSTIKKTIDSICNTNNFSKIQVLWIMLSKGMLHAIDPPRHLWAITKEGIKRWAKKGNITYDIYFFHLGDPAFSPYYEKEKGLKHRLQDFVGEYLLAPIFGGTHLVAILRRNSS